MSDNMKFADGIIFKLPRPNAPDFVKGSISFKVEDAVKWLQENADNGWCNINLKVSRNGKAYADLDTWKPNNQNQSTAKDVNKYRNDSKPAFEPDPEDVF